MGPVRKEIRPRPRIGLAMIVKNESAVIERCLASVMPFIDTWSIVDTGSTDDTPEVIRAALTDLPGTLYERPWVDFGTNRTELMRLARGTADHLLLLDADMTLRVEGEFPTLGDDDYLLTHAGSLTYRIPRLVRGDLPWRYVGATHEYLTADGVPAVTTVLDGVLIDHHADGGSRADKFERDRRLLERAVAADPGDARSVFYLGQTYADLGLVAEAVEQYRRRVALGGWVEECFVAQLRIGELLADTDWSGAVAAFLAAWEIRPSRAEPLYHLARGYRIRGAYAPAALFARAGVAIPFPSDDVLFVSREPYEWGLRFELSIAAFWTGAVAESLALSEDLLADAIPEWLVPWVRHNRDAAVDQLEGNRAGGADAMLDRGDDAAGGGSRPGTSGAASSGTVASPGSVGTRPSALGAPWAPLLAASVEGVRFSRLAPAPADPDEAWSLFNPSITNGPDATAVMLRRSNYVRDPEGRYFTRDGSPFVRTRNRFRLCDAAGAVVAEHPLAEFPGGAPRFTSPVVGVEDLRPVWLDGRWVGFGTCRDRNAGTVPEMVVWELGVEGRGEGTLRVLEPDPEVVGQTPREQKNWMPFVVGGALYVVYRCTPLIVFEVDVDSGRTRVVGGDGPSTGASDAGAAARFTGVSDAGATIGFTGASDAGATAVFTGFRGGSQGCETASGRWRFVVHEVFGATDAERTYVHRFVDVTGGPDEGFALSSVSPRFSFTGARIEFCAGLAHDGDDLVLSFGVDDAQALLARVPVDVVDEWMQPVALHR